MEGDEESEKETEFVGGGKGWMRIVFRRRIWLTVYFFYITCWG